MEVSTHRISISTKGSSDLVDVTKHIADVVTASGLREGTVTVFVVGSTAGITTIEYEPGLRKDLPQLFERLAPQSAAYAHDQTWHDGNGHSHVRASLLGPSLVVPFANNSLVLGTWQQIVVIDFDIRPRTREIVLTVLGRK